MSNEIYDEGLRNRIRAVKQAIAKASKAKDANELKDSIEQVFKEIVQLWIFDGDISNVGFVLARVLDAMRELEQGVMPYVYRHRVCDKVTEICSGQVR